MSDPATGARAPDATLGYGEVPVQPVVPAHPATEVPSGTRTDEGTREQVKQAAGESAHAAGQAAGEVKDTAREQVQRVGAEAKTQMRSVASDVRDRVGSQARDQNDKLVGSLRQAADQLDEMRGDRQDSPAAAVVSRIADGGRQMADYLDRNGPEGVLREVTDFARRRPGAFLATALAAGFVAGRLGKGIMKADEPRAGDTGKPRTDAFVSGTGTRNDGGYGTGDPYDSGYGTGSTAAPGATTAYTDPAGTTTGGYPVAGTEYASTGTGRPVVVDEEYPGGTR
ncbi:hypothetical protein [Couchioplanes caeruleus]|uniref:Uncharacterized protein n=2 Tax=Couchioplanes caeruleus TaxID=56438 RepID=A0A1K0FAN0_9ACTN|nr:hypothetical protein [Couchioplanes caeruleus]OJF09897.1 hypothetical protein BG844_35150 [Couchioplanes caeruleus subsp. caeruleus]ROP27683.1 hypothetical protein EDD30_0372 [Couchioplanes caeruleus]